MWVPTSVRNCRLIRLLPGPRKLPVRKPKMQSHGRCLRTRNETKAQAQKSNRSWSWNPEIAAGAPQRGNMGIMDYYKMQNVQADTDMRNSIRWGKTREVIHRNNFIANKDRNLLPFGEGFLFNIKRTVVSDVLNLVHETRIRASLQNIYLLLLIITIAMNRNFCSHSCLLQFSHARPTVHQYTGLQTCGYVIHG